MEVLIGVLQFTFILFALGILLLFLFLLLLTWAWAQENAETPLNFLEILTTASIEWGALISLAGGQVLGAKTFWEAPPLVGGKGTPKQLPIIFVPSLHTGSGIFRIMVWRLQKHFFTSLWPFSWRPFLKSDDLLEDQLVQFIKDVIASTRSHEIRIVSFGSSRPIVARALAHPSLSEIKKKWISISAAKILSRTMKFLTTIRLKNVYQVEARASKDPDLSIRGTHDVFCYPENVWGPERSVSLSPIGHYAVLLHPTTIQRALDEFSS